MHTITTYYYFLAICLCVFLFVFSAFSSVAQAQSTSLQTGVVLEASPSAPAPFQGVNLRLRSVNTDLTRSPIIWFVNGVEQERGIGKTSFNTTVGGIGSRTEVRAVIQAGIGAIEKSISLAPTKVDILWEAPNAYTPPFYKGKALPASATLIRTVAVPTFVSPSGSILDADEMVYRWKRNNSYSDFNETSGYGQSVIAFNLNYLRPSEFIEVEVSSFGETLNGRAGVVLEPHDPFVALYEKPPLRGVIYEHALEDELVLPESSEVTLVAEPYFFDFPRGHRDLSYEWRVNGETLEDAGGSLPNEIVLQTPEGEGDADIDISIEHNNRLLQSARSSFNVVFGGQAAANFFGF